MYAGPGCSSVSPYYLDDGAIWLLHVGVSFDSFCLRHATIRPSPGCTLAQWFLTSSAQALAAAPILSFTSCRNCTQAGDNEVSFFLRQASMAPPPGLTPGQYF